MISLIAAVALNRAIGNEGKMPWYLPADLKYFKQITTGETVVMGRKTYESIGKALPNRTNIVLSMDMNFNPKDAIVLRSLSEVLYLYKTTNIQHLFVMGGAEIYKQFLPFADRLHITEIQAFFKGDAFFPEIDNSEWACMSKKSYNADSKNPYKYAFSVYYKPETKG